MKKKIVAFSLIAALSLAMFAGCGKAEDTQSAEMKEQIQSLEQRVAVLEAEVDLLKQLQVSSTTATGGQETDTAKEQETQETQEEQPAQETTTPATQGDASDGNFVQQHGALRVEGAQLVDQNGDPITLYGMSTHGIAWYPEYLTYDAMKTLRDDWGINCIRIAMYTAEDDGYCTGGDKEYLKNLVYMGVDAATNLGMYVIVDWHVLKDQDPWVYSYDAQQFLNDISKKYANYDNVIYEICNEPNGYSTWGSIKSYAEQIIPYIRHNDSDAVVLVGTPNWCQDIDQAAKDPLNFTNIMYTMHFYAGSHTQDYRNRLDSYVKNGLPVFVSEFGMCDASGSGGNNFDEAQKWMDLLDQYQVSRMCWNLSNKNETSAVISPSCDKTSGWTESDLSESGKWIRNFYRKKSGMQ